MGYVVRCSATEAVHTGGRTFFKVEDHALVELQPPTAEGMSGLRALYAEETWSDAVIDYGRKFLISMNNGDYAKPTAQVQGASSEFRLLAMPIEENLFEGLLASVRFEGVTKGRQGTVLLNPDAMRGTPIVRTTTKYAKPAQCFKAAHAGLAHHVQESGSLLLGFNNALIETYTNAYATMGFHSDQDLDLEEGSSIAVFSCYRHPELANPPRKLVIQSKEPGGSTFEIPLQHNSVVMWSLEANRRFKHKIVLETGAQTPANEWLGVTFRTSKTFVRFRGGQACFEDGTPLTVATNAETREFYRLRRRENEETGFAYPRLTYSVSRSDTMPPEC